MKKGYLYVVIMLLISILFMSCSYDEREVLAHGNEIETEENSGGLDDEKNEAEIEEIDLNIVQPNELGDIMVLMYHHIREPEGQLSRTPDNFRRDLKNLYDQGYRPISLYDYATGNITTEAGYTPVVITFDDGHKSNFNMIMVEGEWIIDPNSAIGILVDFHEQYPDFPLKATFFINGGVPFGQREFIGYKLNYIVEKGMEIGNHTYGHVNLAYASSEKIQAEIGKLNIFIKQYLPDYEVNTFALPYGSKPKNENLRKYLSKGEYDGEKYENIAIVEVGWYPYYSPFNPKFDYTRIKRVNASEINVDNVGMYDWLKALELGKRIKFVSDGNPNNITLPEKYNYSFNEEISEKQVILY